MKAYLKDPLADAAHAQELFGDDVVLSRVGSTRTASWSMSVDSIHGRRRTARPSRPSCWRSRVALTDEEWVAALERGRTTTADVLLRGHGVTHPVYGRFCLDEATRLVELERRGALVVVLAMPRHDGVDGEGVAYMLLQLPNAWGEPVDYGHMREWRPFSLDTVTRRLLEDGMQIVEDELRVRWVERRGGGGPTPAKDVTEGGFICRWLRKGAP